MRNKLKRFMAAVAVTAAAAVSAGMLPVNVFADTADAHMSSVEGVGTKIENGGFEDYQYIRSNQVSQSLVPNWSTTAKGELIEFMKEGTPLGWLSPVEGKQVAELNADEQSSLYQYVSAVQGATLEWGLSHTGRDGTDTMLLTIGPKQDVAPSKKEKGNPTQVTADSMDQFMKMGSWIAGNSDLIKPSIENGYNGSYKKYTIYSRRFGNDGGFKLTNGKEGYVGNLQNNFSGDFSIYKTDEFTEEWNIWMITTKMHTWVDYGSNIFKTRTSTTNANDNVDYTY